LLALFKIELKELNIKKELIISSRKNILPNIKIVDKYLDGLYILEVLKDKELYELYKKEKDSFSYNDEHIISTELDFPLDSFAKPYILNSIIVDYLSVKILRDSNKYVSLITANVLAYCEQTQEFLFQKRDSNTSLYPNFYTIAGGGFDPLLDNNLEDTARREFKEEVGIEELILDENTFFSKELDLYTKNNIYSSGSLQLNFYNGRVSKESLNNIQINEESKSICRIHKDKAIEMLEDECLELTPLLKESLKQWFILNKDRYI